MSAPRCTRWPRYPRSSGTSAWPRAACGCWRPGSRSPIRSTAARPPSSPARWTTRRRAWARTAPRTGGCSARWCGMPGTCCPSSWARSGRCPPGRWRWPGSPCPACFRPASCPGPSAASRPGRCWLAWPLTSAFGLMLTITAHVAGWPVVAGGSGQITGALLADLISLGGQVDTGRWVSSLGDLPPARVVMLDVTPLQFTAMAGARLGARERRGLRRFRYGPGVCKVDWALAGPVPWLAPACHEAATVHVAGSFADVARSEADVAAGRLPERPYAIVVQPGVVDPGRAPDGCRALWGYCHVPGGSPADMSGRIEAQIERFAPGFRDLILARSVRSAAEIERYNPSYVGGDINAGAATVRQTLLRPAPQWNPYRTSVPGVYLCSASTPPGGGVHGMCGYWAAGRHGGRRRAAGPPARPPGRSAAEDPGSAVGQEADPCVPRLPRALARVVEVVTGDPQPGAGHQHVVGAEAAGPGRVEHHGARRRRQADHAGRAHRAGAGVVAAMGVVRPPLMPAEV